MFCSDKAAVGLAVRWLFQSYFFSCSVHGYIGFVLTTQQLHKPSRLEPSGLVNVTIRRCFNYLKLLTSSHFTPGLACVWEVIQLYASIFLKYISQTEFSESPLWWESFLTCGPTRLSEAARYIWLVLIVIFYVVTWFLTPPILWWANQ